MNNIQIKREFDHLIREQQKLIKTLETLQNETIKLIDKNSSQLEPPVMPNEVLAGGHCIDCKDFVLDRHQNWCSNKDTPIDFYSDFDGKNFGCIKFQKDESQREA